MNFRKSFVSFCMLSMALTAFSWGQKGHDVTAFIAENNLTPKTYAEITDLLDGKSIVYWSNWLDNASHTPQYAYSKTWHYKNIDSDVAYEEAPLLESGDVVRSIYEQSEILQDPMASRTEKQLALKILVHLMGDIHQPMHMGHASDLGGNRWTVNYFGRDSNLHSVWDSSLPESAHKWTYTEWREQIDRASQEETSIILQNGNPDIWGKETYEICKEVYDKTPEGFKISYDYVADWTPIIENQFLKGGIRLADILNSIFDPEYIQANSFIKTSSPN
ncbi:MAG: S1/P1 nuclease [Muribaculaceae bacterium]|nr:S1/P1 nuclease [Muribaculaceae bacterium]